MVGCEDLASSLVWNLCTSVLRVRSAVLHMRSAVLHVRSAQANVSSRPGPVILYDPFRGCRGVNKLRCAQDMVRVCGAWSCTCTSRCFSYLVIGGVYIALSLPDANGVMVSCGGSKYLHNVSELLKYKEA